MFKSFLYKLDKPEDNDLLQRIEKEAVVDKYFTALGGTVISIVSIMILGIMAIYLYTEQAKIPPKTYSVKLTKQEPIKNEAGQLVEQPPKQVATQIISLSAPSHQLKNVISWLKEAIMASYSFSFQNYDKVVDESYYYFTADGYTTYLNALKMNKIKTTLDKDLMQISIIPVSEPILVNAQQFGETTRWLFRTEAVINYTTGNQTINDKYIVETLIVQVPPYKSIKGLGIAQYSLTKK